MRVLVVEDEEQLADAVARGLRLHAIAVDVAYDGREALELTAYVDYDVVVLDRDLPDVHGDEVCRELAAASGASRILMLTAAGRVRDRVGGLALGADDYLVKPFAFAELVARVRALARRSPRAAPPVLERAGIRLDPARRTVIRDGRQVALGRREFDVLRELMRAGGGLVSSARLRASVWDEHAGAGTGVLRVTLTSLRRKLGDPPVIENVPGRGYRL
ncbi:response regulator transcription factor [Microbispora triticiradicis]|uniref:Response regulator transcription factor n=2 Tax=Microbispora TaxID=2005 RepID=A0ABY3LUN4_9ACTN|nr:MULTISPECIES: response regulator transcription factor [Microbispora]TLP60633.1 response regulator transcription factor [Microbispora fusca]TYB54651.1 response regulator transcription factor [Microbispora tritici]GLW20870.1 transcriptional regulatory protein CutR [Microbispora amethystogenes]